MPATQRGKGLSTDQIQGQLFVGCGTRSGRGAVLVHDLLFRLGAGTEHGEAHAEIANEEWQLLSYMTA